MSSSGGLCAGRDIGMLNAQLGGLSRSSREAASMSGTASTISANVSAGLSAPARAVRASALSSVRKSSGALSTTSPETAVLIVTSKGSPGNLPATTLMMPFPVDRCEKGRTGIGRRERAITEHRRMVQRRQLEHAIERRAGSPKAQSLREGMRLSEKFRGQKLHAVQQGCVEGRRRLGRDVVHIGAQRSAPLGAVEDINQMALGERTNAFGEERLDREGAGVGAGW